MSGRGKGPRIEGQWLVRVPGEPNQYHLEPGAGVTPNRDLAYRYKWTYVFQNHKNDLESGRLEAEHVETGEIWTPGNPRNAESNDQALNHFLMPREAGADIRKLANNEDATGDAKPSNPKDAIGSLKARWFSYLPLRVLVFVGLALKEGAIKYGRHNYRIAGVRASVYVDACVSGHLTPWMEGEDTDPDSNLNHIDKAIASLIVLRDGMLEGNWVDDRPPSAKNWQAFMADAHAKSEALLKKYPEPKAAFTIADTQP